MAKPTSYQVIGEVMHSEVDDGAVLLHLDEGVYFGLNKVGARIWALIVEGRTAEACITQIEIEYDVDVETAAADYIKLTADLHAQGLVKNL